MTPEENKATIRRSIEDAWNEGNIEVLDEILASHYVAHDPLMGDIHGPEGFKELVAGYRAAFPDIRIAIEQQIAEGDQVATRWVAHGTHEGELMGFPASGRPARVTGVVISRFGDDGTIVEDWPLYDALGMMQQIGAIPAMA